MKNLLGLMAICSLITMSACEDVITINVPRNETKLVVDAQITDASQMQTVKLMLSQAYFDNTNTPPANGAKVKIIDDNGIEYEFLQRYDKDKKLTIYYDWLPKAGEAINKIGTEYTLAIDYDGIKYESKSKLKPVPKIDSLIYVYKDRSDEPGLDSNDIRKGYRAEFYARDLKGDGDCYFIKGYRYSKTKGVWNYDRNQIAYDAAFQPGARADGLVFILPIRRSITNNLTEPGDSVKAEIYSVSVDHFNFLRSADQDAQNQGLFAVPPATFATNIFAKTDKTKKALGWFSVSSVSEFKTVIDPKKASPDTD